MMLLSIVKKVVNVILTFTEIHSIMMAVKGFESFMPTVDLQDYLLLTAWAVHFNMPQAIQEMNMEFCQGMTIIECLVLM